METSLSQPIKIKYPKYYCGKCSTEFERRLKETPRCPECGYRIIYKSRTEKMVEYIAR